NVSRVRQKLEATPRCRQRSGVSRSVRSRCRGRSRRICAGMTMSSGTIKLAVLISGSGTTLQNLIDQIAAKKLDAEIRVVIASRLGIKGIDRAKTAGIRCETIERKQLGEKFSERIFAICREAQADLVCLAGWLSLLKIPADWQGRVMNIHPALLPS